MQVFRGSLFLIVFLIPAFLFAQPANDAVKEKQRRRNVLIEQILADLPNLKSGENRAIVYAKAGNLIWDADQKQATQLFQNAVGELIGAQTLAETDKRPTGYQNDLLTGGNTRPQILNTIANRNAELALEMLVKSRPAAITKALAAGTTKTSKISDGQNLVYLAQNEINLEQNFLRLAADQNPD